MTFLRWTLELKNTLDVVKKIPKLKKNKRIIIKKIFLSEV